MVDGLDNFLKQCEISVKRYSSALSPLGKLIYGLSVVFLLIGFYNDNLLPFAGSLFIGAVAIGNNDWANYNREKETEADKARSLVEFYSLVSTILNSLTTFRTSYLDSIEQGNRKDSFFRGMDVPWQVYIPTIDASEIRRALVNLTFTTEIDEFGGDNSFFDAPLDRRVKSYTFLASKLWAIPSILDMWRVRNEVYEQLEFKSNEDNIYQTKFNPETIDEALLFQNFLELTNECLEQIEGAIEFLALILGVFIPSSKKLIDDDVLQKIPIPSSTFVYHSVNRVLDPLSQDENHKLRKVAAKVVKDFDLIKGTDDN
ncbi:hypothetical protein [Pseudidiomarina sediminum]|uniref:hypothetical protein n=1 Tax=Pseudidiomarina sediminum TaxID=431675 RepID=UPI001C94986E|nr:hypothetical protein [Pseudidiomarina sediminum]MBY6064817.1 hypothetical protein [Pseudidiomarina sediminum]